MVLDPVYPRLLYCYGMSTEILCYMHELLHCSVLRGVWLALQQDQDNQIIESCIVRSDTCVEGEFNEQNITSFMDDDKNYICEDLQIHFYCDFSLI